jgi:hypothetical protein
MIPEPVGHRLDMLLLKYRTDSLPESAQNVIYKDLLLLKESLDNAKAELQFELKEATGTEAKQVLEAVGKLL